jgi:ABC-2 type transport system ATP-binding protein
MVQALMHQPDLLFLDEPTAGLDPLMQQEVYRLLRETQARGATVFFSSHIISEVETLAERVGIIRNGVMAEVAEPARLTSMTMRRVRVGFLEAVDPAPLGMLEGVELLADSNGLIAHLQVEGDMNQMIKALAAFPVKDFETERVSLEEIFLAYYESEQEER